MAFAYLGQETTGLDRIAGYFFNGNNVQYAMLVDDDGKRVAVFSTDGKKLYTERGVRVPEGFVPKSIDAFRSRQTGKLVVGLGGFIARPGNHQSGCVVVTDYLLQE